MVEDSALLDSRATAPTSLMIYFLSDERRSALGFAGRCVGPHLRFRALDNLDAWTRRSGNQARAGDLRALLTASLGKKVIGSNW